MICSFEEGITLLRKWEEEETDLRCVFWRLGATVTSMPWIMRGKCWVHEASTKLVLALSEESSFDVLLSSIVRFEFGTPLDLKTLSPESDYLSWLSIYLGADLILMVGERRPPQN